MHRGALSGGAATPPAFCSEPDLRGRVPALSALAAVTLVALAQSEKGLGQIADRPPRLSGNAAIRRTQAPRARASSETEYRARDQCQ